MPFAAVTGLEDALRRKERELGLLSKRDVTDEEAAAINEMISALKRGDRVTIDYYVADSTAAGRYDDRSYDSDSYGFADTGCGEYVTAEGRIVSVDRAGRRIVLERADEERRRLQENLKSEEIEIDIEDIMWIRTENTGERR